MNPHWTLPCVVTLSDGAETVETSQSVRVVGMLRSLDERAAKATKDAKDAYVRLGRVLLELRRILPRGTWGRLIEESGVHRRRAERAIRIAAECADADGRLDADKVAHVIREAKMAGRIPATVSEGEPSIRMIDRALTRTNATVCATHVSQNVRDTQTNHRTDATVCATHVSQNVRDTRTDELPPDLAEKVLADIEAGEFDIEGDGVRGGYDEIEEEVVRGAAGEQLGLEAVYAEVREELDEIRRMAEEADAGELRRIVRGLRAIREGMAGGGGGGGGGE